MAENKANKATKVNKTTTNKAKGTGKPKTSGNRPIIILIIVLVVIIVLAGAYKMFNGNKEATNDETAQVQQQEQTEHNDKLSEIQSKIDAKQKEIDLSLKLKNKLGE